MNVREVNPGIVGRRVSCIENGARVTGVITGISEDKYTVNVHIKFDKPLECWDMDAPSNGSWFKEEYKSWARKCDGWGNLQHTYFIDTLDWLENYKPEDDHFTSKYEMQEISDNLDLKNKNVEELTEIRNDVVRFYDRLIDKAGDDRNKIHDFMTSMMSVTAVIDHYKWNEGGEV